MLFLHSFFGKQTFGVPREILDKFMVVFEVYRLAVQIDDVAHRYLHSGMNFWPHDVELDRGASCAASRVAMMICAVMALSIERDSP
jgi:hypothetical protein